MHVTAVLPANPGSLNLNAYDLQAIGHTAFAVGRFFSAFAGMVFKPRRILLVLFAGMIITSALTMTCTGNAAVAMIILVMFFEV